jgi:hypothetical protein
MSRSLSTILTAIRTDRQARPELADLDGSLSAADYAVWEECIAYNHWLFENKVDTLRAEIQQIVDNNEFGTDPWWQNKILEFQYDPANPQVIQRINGILQYPVIDPTLRIIARSSVKTIVVNNRSKVSVKVAKLNGATLMPLNPSELAALVDYTLKIRPSGISLDVVSLYADRLKLVADVYYKGQYPVNLVQANVIAAIGNYCQYISYQELRGEVKLLTLTDFVEAVPGVSDFVINQASGRDQAAAVGAGTVFNRIYSTSAGYIIPEDTVGYTLLDTLTMIADV